MIKHHSHQRLDFRKNQVSYLTCPTLSTHDYASVPTIKASIMGNITHVVTITTGLHHIHSLYDMNQPSLLPLCYESSRQ